MCFKVPSPTWSVARTHDPIRATSPARVSCRTVCYFYRVYVEVPRSFVEIVRNGLSPDVPLFLLLGELKAPCMNTQSSFKVRLNICPSWRRTWLNRRVVLRDQGDVSAQVSGQESERLEARRDRDSVQGQCSGSRVFPRVRPTHAVERGLEDGPGIPTPARRLVDCSRKMDCICSTQWFSVGICVTARSWLLDAVYMDLDEHMTIPRCSGTYESSLLLLKHNLVYCNNPWLNHTVVRSQKSFVHFHFNEVDDFIDWYATNAF